jgi:hypothetical protein
MLRLRARERQGRGSGRAVRWRRLPCERG